MIKQVKLKRTQKLNKKNGKRKHNKKNNIQKCSLKKQDGGSNTKEKFEVKRLTDIDYSQFSLTKAMNADTDWGSSPGPPPTDCCIL